MNSKLLKTLGLVATVAGVALSLLNDYVDDKKMDEKIAEGINKALTSKENEEQES